MHLPRSSSAADLLYTAAVARKIIVPRKNLLLLMSKEMAK